jgi:cytochrome d ubiquinol oxidase subunit I
VERLSHVIIGAFILGGFFVMSVSAYYLLKRRHEDFARRSFNIALPFATFFSIAALLSGHSQAINVAQTQPAKLAAFEGHFNTIEGGAPIYLWGIPSEEQERVHAGIAIPGMLSFLVHGDWSKPVTALDDPAIVPKTHTTAPGESLRDYWPPVNLSFQLYHAMVGLGGVFIVLTVYALILRWRKTLFGKRWLLWVFVFAVIGPMVANQAGWAAAEVGRQPWIVYGMLKTADAASKAVSGAEILTSITLFGLIYVLLLLVWVYVMDSKIRLGPEEVAAAAPAGAQERWLDTAVRRASASAGNSMTSARSPAVAGDPAEET